MAKINFGGVWEEVVTSEEFPLSRAQEVLKNETVAVLGYGVQGPGQALNLRDNGIRVIVGQREGGATWTEGRRGRLRSREDPLPRRGGGEAGDDHRVPAVRRGPDADVADAQTLPDQGENPLLLARIFHHLPRADRRDPAPRTSTSILVAPKGSGRSLRTNFLDGSGINSSYAIFQDASGKATEKTLALGIAIGSGYLFPTTFEKEVFSDLTGERGRPDGLPWRASWRRSTTCSGKTATARARPSTKPWRS